jgi:hypothetical protein
VGVTLAFGIIALGTRDFGAVVARAENGKVVDFHLGADHEEGPAAPPAAEVSLGRLAALMFGLGAVGAALEAAVTASVAAYLAKAAPRLLA